MREGIPGFGRDVVLVVFVGLGLGAPDESGAQELGSCIVHQSATTWVDCQITPGPPAETEPVQIVVETRTPDGTGPATLKITYPDVDLPVVTELDEVNLLLEDDLTYGVRFDDLNFDGYIDFGIAEFLPAAPNVPHHYWLYDSTTRRYIANEQLRQVTSPAVDHERKHLQTSWRDNCCRHGVTVYEWRGPHLVRILDAQCELVVENETEKVQFSQWTTEQGIHRPESLASYDSCIARLDAIR